MLSTRFRNGLYLYALRHSQFKPKIEVIQKLGSFYICNIASKENHDFGISDKVSSGMSVSKDLAVAKSLSEYTERLAYRNGKKNGHPLCSTLSTEGFASYPRFKFGALNLVREKSLLESIERYCWTYFWHNKSAFSIREDTTILSEFGLSNLGIEKIEFIHPEVASSYKFCICLAKISSTGLVVGGACSSTTRGAEYRAFTEALRHFIAIKNIRNGYTAEDLNYGNRLNYLAMNGCQMFADRISLSGKTSILLPELEIDALIPHVFSPYQHVYRTRFFGQPEFIDARYDVGYI